MFLSTFEKALDPKRRLVIPADFRSPAMGTLEGIFCFPAIEADCLEAGGQALFDLYHRLIEELAFGDPLRQALETVVMGGMHRLTFDTAGRITLPDELSSSFDLNDKVILTGLGDRFQIWEPKIFASHKQRARQLAREGLARLKEEQRAANTMSKSVPSQKEGNG